MKPKNVFIKRINHLLAISNTTVENLCEDMGLSQDHIEQWETDQSELSLDEYIKIADFFGVSLDYLTGRINVSSQKLSDNFEDMKRGIVERVVQDYPLSDEETSDLAVQYIKKHLNAAPYPYNMVIYTPFLTLPLTEDQLNGIDEAVNGLPEEERKALLFRYKDHYSMSKVSEALHTTAGKAQTAIDNGCKRLSTGTYLYQILKGARGQKLFARNSALNQEEDQLKNRMNQIEQLEKLCKEKIDNTDFDRIADLFCQVWGIDIHKILNQNISEYLAYTPNCSIATRLKNYSIMTNRDAILFDVQNHYDSSAWLRLNGIALVSYENLRATIWQACGYRIGKGDNAERTPMEVLLEYSAKKGPETDFSYSQRIINPKTGDDDEDEWIS